MSIAKLVPEIDDIERVLYLYDNNNSTSNEVQQFWKNQILFFCKHVRKSFTFTLKELIDAYTVHGVRPSYLDRTISELLKAKGDRCALVESSTYDTNSTENVSILFSALSFTMQYFSFQTPDVYSKQYVSCALLREAQDFILNNLEKLDEKYCVMLVSNEEDVKGFTFASFISRLMDTPSENDTVFPDLLRNLSTDDLDILLRFLKQNKHIIYSDDKKFLKIIKRKVPISSSTSSKSLFASSAAENTQSISEYDKTRLELQISILKLETKIKELEEKADNYLSRAIAAKVSFLQRILL